jgi:hypothetical protein
MILSGFVQICTRLSGSHFPVFGMRRYDATLYLFVFRGESKEKAAV